MTNDISERAERGEDAAMLLRELWNCLAPAPQQEVKSALAMMDAGPSEFQPNQPFALWARKWQPFHDLLDINTPEAHLAAAMMLVPEGWEWTLCVAAYEPCLVTIPSGDDRKDATHGTGPTPAHALIAALARSNPDG